MRQHADLLELCWSHFTALLFLVSSLGFARGLLLAYLGAASVFLCLNVVSIGRNDWSV